MGLKDFFIPKEKKQKRKYEGASRSRRTKNWFTGSGDANTQIKPSLPLLRERSRDLRRNNAHAHKIIELVTSNIVGKGISTIISNDPTPNNQNEKDWKEWTQSSLIDFEGRNNIGALQRLLIGSTVESGEVIIRKRFVNDDFSIKYQVLESDFINDSLADGIQTNGNLIIQGVEFSPDGRKIGYHLHSSHPGGIASSMSNLTSSNLITASEIYHLFRQERPGQVRGVPWLAPVMINLRDFADFEDAVLMRQKVSALFVAFVRDLSGDVDCDDDSDLGERMTPALIEHLPPGKDISFANPPDPTNYKEFTSAQLRTIAAGVGLSYEALTGDLTEVNFSSARMGWIEMGRNINAWREHIIIQHFMKNVEKDFLQMQNLRGVNTNGLTFTHVPPRREMLDPTKEIPAMVESMRAGLSSRSEEVASLGKDIKDVNEKIKKDNESNDSNNFVFDSDPRLTNKTGKLHMEGGQPDEEQEEKN